MSFVIDGLYRNRKHSRVIVEDSNITAEKRSNTLPESNLPPSNINVYTIIVQIDKTMKSIDTPTTPKHPNM